VSDHMSGASVLLVGTGAMGVAYAQVLRGMAVPFDAVGRGAAACAAFEKQTGIVPRCGGVQRLLDSEYPPPSLAIVAVTADQLAPVAIALLRSGAPRVLLEKPGALDVASLEAIVAAAHETNAAVWIAYNRRFLASVRQAKSFIAEDGGLLSCTFEITEWADDVDRADLPAAVKRAWFLVNSTHVCDLAFAIAGRPAAMHAEVAGSLAWHPAGAAFAGSGVTDQGVLFSYSGNWQSAGRWSLELMTRSRRLILRPLETLAVQHRGTMTSTPVALDDALDRQFKPGLFRQVDAARQGSSDLLTVERHLELVRDVYSRMCPYDGAESIGYTAVRSGVQAAVHAS
jgi:predicted dehydrogenase